MEMIELYRHLCPYPTVGRDNTYLDGFLHGQPHFCIKCKHKACWERIPPELSDSVMHFECRSGFSLIPVVFPNGTILINGVIESMLNKNCPATLRRDYKSHKIVIETVIRWRYSMSKAQEQIDAVTTKNVTEAISSLHDIKTATNLVFRNAEAFISQVPGTTDEEKIENAPAPFKALYKSISLLNTRLTMSSFVSNPQSASFGNRRATPVYKIFDRMCRLFEEIAAKKNVNIFMKGSSYNLVKCYDSFETLALVLVDNAVKYSLTGESVIVRARDVKSGVEVSVESKGPIVHEGERNLIFEKGFRSANAKKMALGGAGLGLYIAKTIADAHGISIKYEARNPSPEGDVGTNVFFFSVES
jgi:K+-sensing histidine kinase KdpD